MAANVNNYIAAGNAAVKNTYASLAAARDNAPKYDEIAKEGMRARAKEKIAALKADMDVEHAKIKAETELTVDKTILDANKSIAKSNRKTKFAGKIAAAGAAIATTLIPPPEIIKPSARDFSTYKGKLQGNLESSKAEVDKWKSMPDADPSVPADAVYKESAVGDTQTSTTLRPGTSNSTFLVGNTGISTGAHLHAGIWSKSKGGYIDPTGRLGQYITGPDGQPLSSYTVTSPYGPRSAPTAGASTNHRGIDFGIAEGTALNINLKPAAHKPRFKDARGGYMNAYTIDDDLELVLAHGQRLPGER